jgi:hypothetical protein
VSRLHCGVLLTPALEVSPGRIARSSPTSRKARGVRLKLESMIGDPSRDEISAMVLLEMTMSQVAMFVYFEDGIDQCFD